MRCTSIETAFILILSNNQNLSCHIQAVKGIDGMCHVYFGLGWLVYFSSTCNWDRFNLLLDLVSALSSQSVVQTFIFPIQLFCHGIIL